MCRLDATKRRNKMSKIQVSCLTKMIGAFLKKGHPVVVLPSGAISPLSANDLKTIQTLGPSTAATCMSIPKSHGCCRETQKIGRVIRKTPASITFKKKGKGKLWTKAEVRLVQLIRVNNRTKNNISKVARTMGRSYNSITAKMSNLDNLDTDCHSRGFKNGGPFDREVMQEFIASKKTFEKQVTALARKMGLGKSVARKDSDH